MTIERAAQRLTALYATYHWFDRVEIAGSVLYVYVTKGKHAHALGKQLKTYHGHHVHFQVMSARKAESMVQ